MHPGPFHPILDPVAADPFDYLLRGIVMKKSPSKKRTTKKDDWEFITDVEQDDSNISKLVTIIADIIHDWLGDKKNKPK